MTTTTIPLVPSRERAWRMGLGNMLRKENFAWWHTRRWWIQCLLWALLLNGMVEINIRGDMNPANAGLNYLTSAGIGLAIGVIVMMQDSILSERHSGTTAWVLSKPLHRPAYILAKVVAYAFAFLLTGPVFSGALLYLQLSLHGLEGMVPLGFVEAMGLVYLNQLFYMTLALMLATLFDTRGPVLGISLGLALAGLLVGFSTSTALTRLLAEILPWQFTIPFGANSPLAGYLAFGEPLPTVVPVIATVLWCLIFVGVALWRIGREEF